jgi:hypothetical protein
MLDRILESDWKIFRQLHPVILDRFCRRILEEIEGITSDTNKSNHEKHIAIYELARRRDREIENGSHDLRRSTAMLHICSFRRQGLFTDAEFARFSEEACEEVERLLEFARRY